MTVQPNLEEILEVLEAAEQRRLYRRIDFFDPYTKQLDFFAFGREMRERLLMAGNQLGKTEAGAFETACHLTGQYPKWWTGRRWARPVKGWAAGETSLLVRDVQQKKLCGEPGVESSFGTGYIPKAAFVDKPSLARGVTDAFDTIQVEHQTDGVKDGVSILRFKSYEQGRAKFQGETIDFVWDDEEPPEDVYSEILTRTVATKGMTFTTFTPLKGMSNVVRRFLHEPSPDRAFVMMTIDDVKHISEEDKIKIVAGYLAHEREARARGVPMLGSGRIFPYAEEGLLEPAIQTVPAHWFKLWCIDFGIGHPFAAVLLLWDKDNDVIHVHHTIRVADQLPLQHWQAMKQIGAAVPVAWPQDGHQRQQGSANADQLAVIYKKHGALMHADHATFPDGSNSTEAGILEMQERMTQGRFKVASHLSEWLEEFRLYHRKDGLIVKVHDDIMSATRVGVMMKRIARAVPLGSQGAKRRNFQQVADGVDFDLS